MSLMSLAIRAVIDGQARPAALVGDVKPNDPIRYKDYWSKFAKRAPGDYIVTLGRGDDTLEEIPCSSAFEAKLTAIEGLVETLKAPAPVQAEPDELDEEELVPPAPQQRVVPHTRRHR